MKSIVKRFLGNGSGATAIEYAMIASLISILIVAGASSIGSTLSSTFNSLAGKVL
jgi:pilus assembly protein Flp/PilA